jgi:hypothetical protein
VNLDQYIQGILKPFFKQLIDEERQYDYFQQGDAMAHTANSSKKTLQEVFDGKIIRTALWPPGSADVSVCDFYLWGIIEGKVYRNKSHTAETLQSKIRNVIDMNIMDKLQRVLQGFI